MGQWSQAATNFYTHKTVIQHIASLKDDEKKTLEIYPIKPIVNVTVKKKTGMKLKSIP